ncbi:relaxase/mobilization nuclease domain-containing protein [Streptococcus agalactiae]
MTPGELNSGKQVLAHHIIQSFSPEDNLTPEQVHNIGRQTMMEFYRRRL